MKTRFTTYDIVCSVAELQKLIGMRVNQVYDIDHRTYLIRLQRSEEKQVLLIESGNRIHTTSFEWPKNVAPSGFSMKMRKHLKNKRLESLSQVGTDRIIDLQFGSGNAAYHVILEAYDRGNIVLTDCEWTILNILRPHTQEDQIRFAVREKYPLSRAHASIMPPIEEILQEITNSKPGESLKKVLNPLLSFGPSVIEHILLIHGISVGAKIGKDFNVVEDSAKLIAALHDGSKMMESAKQSTSSGYIIQKKELKPSAEAEEDFIYTNLHFHPFLFEQYKDLPYKEFPSFDLAVDEYFSTMEGQKLDLKALQLEREALKKLENVKRDRDQRLQLLESTQDLDRDKAELITRNKELVDDCITAVQNAVANRAAWSLIEKLLKEAGSTGDPIGIAVKELKLETNHISLLLHDPCCNIQSMVVDIDLAHTAFGNARKYYNQRRSAANKHRKTIESQDKALKSAERKTKQTLKELQAIHKINKLRKTYWFEKFYWFISSENYLVIGGRDKQQNELIVKRYFKPGDAYVHADLIGASSVVVKNPSGAPIPSKTLAEAGTMAIAYSTAWEAKIVPAAWWVHHDQVSKTAPTGQYLKTGSFMIRGKKNFLQPCQLIMGLGFLFCLEEGSIERHKDERKVRVLDEEFEATESVIEEDKEIKIEDDSDDDEQIEMKVELQPIEEERDNETTLEEKIECSKSSSEDDGENPEFPDTQIKIDISGPKIMLHVDSKQSTNTEQNDENAIVHLRDDKSVRNTSNKEKSSKARCSDRSKGQTIGAEVEGKKEEQKVIRRGQKSKLKKMKEKYKDQDEEDRRLSMQILQSAGAAKQNKRKNKNRDPSGPKQQGRKRGSQQRYECSIYDVDADWHPGLVVDEGAPVQLPIQPPVQHQDDVEPTDIVEDEDTGPGPEVDMLDQLTGKPMAEDELLFAVPVIAPYNTLLNYKFKVKLTPGTGKRGKAARTALEVFLKDKTITSREKDLLKAVREDITARNIPGKVKISAPQIQKLRK